MSKLLKPFVMNETIKWVYLQSTNERIRSVSIRTKVVNFKMFFGMGETQKFTNISISTKNIVHVKFAPFF